MVRFSPFCRRLNNCALKFKIFNCAFQKSFVYFVSFVVQTFLQESRGLYSADYADWFTKAFAESATVENWRLFLFFSDWQHCKFYRGHRNARFSP